MEPVLLSVIDSAALPNVSSLKSASPAILRPLSRQRFRPLLRLVCQQGKETTNVTHSTGFSVLSRDIPWNKSSVWTTMALYMFNLHVPLGVCGLSIVSYAIHMPVLDPQVEACSLLVIQIMELAGVLLLLNTDQSNLKVIQFFENQDSKERNWILATILSLLVLLLVVFVSSILLDGLFGFKEVSDPFLKKMISNSTLAKSASVMVYCLVAPLLEETVYRGFLLSSLASTMSWQKAVFLSSIAFSAAHFSLENFVQLFLIGCVLGCCYCWTGKLLLDRLYHEKEEHTSAYQ